MTPSRRSPDQVATRCPTRSRGSTHASTRAWSASAEATASWTSSIGWPAGHSSRATPSPTVVTWTPASFTGRRLVGPPEVDRSQGWHDDVGVRRLPEVLAVERRDAAEVADSRAGVELGVGVEHLFPGAGGGQPEPVTVRDG